MITITEGLQEIKTLLKRIEKKRDFIRGYLWRQNHVRDPHEKNGGSHALIKKERQAIKDLEDNIIDIRHRIAVANNQTTITVCGEARSIAEWLIWRRELATNRKTFLESISGVIRGARADATRKGIAVVGAESKAGDNDLVINVDEKQLSDEIEKIEEIISTLDGQLSLKNSTVHI